MTSRTGGASSRTPYLRPFEASILTAPVEILSIIVDTVSMETISSLVVISKGWRDRFVTYFKLHFEVEMTRSLELVSENLGSDPAAEKVKIISCSLAQVTGFKEMRTTLQSIVIRAANILQEADSSLVEKLCESSGLQSPLFLSEIALLAELRARSIINFSFCLELISKSRLGIVVHNAAIEAIKTIRHTDSSHMSKLAAKGDYQAAIRSMNLENGSACICPLNMIACSAIMNRDFVIAGKIIEAHQDCRVIREHALPTIIDMAQVSRQFDRAIDAALLYPGLYFLQTKNLVSIATNALKAGDFLAVERAILSIKHHPCLDDVKCSYYQLIEELANKYQFRLAFHLVSIEVKYVDNSLGACRQKIKSYTALADLAMNAGLTGLVLSAIKDVWSPSPHWKWEIFSKAAKKFCERGDFTAAEIAVLMIAGSDREEVSKERDYLYFDLAEIALKAGKLDQMVLFLKHISPRRYWRMKYYVDALQKKLSREPNLAVLRAVEIVKALFPSAF